MPTKKTTIKKAPVAKASAKMAGKYVEAVGRRKTAVARVRLYPEEKETKGFAIEINGKKFADYFPLERERRNVAAPFLAIAVSYPVTVKMKGGGSEAQAEAVRLGITRALVAIEGSHRGKLKMLGFLKRDPRMVERKKFGHRKARRMQQWRKR